MNEVYGLYLRFFHLIIGGTKMKRLCLYVCIFVCLFYNLCGSKELVVLYTGDTSGFVLPCG